MFTVGINTQILEFSKEDSLENIAAKVILTITLTIFVALILYKLYYYINFHTILTNNLTFPEITREKILNETIFESKIRRNYMLIMLVVESIIIPTIFI